MYAGAFSECGNLKSVTLKGDSDISEYAFFRCDSLTVVKIGNGARSIGKAAFSGCSKLWSVTIPDSVNVIGSGAFSYCGLQCVNYSGTSWEWDCIYIESNNDPLNRAEKYYNCFI